MARLRHGERGRLPRGPARRRVRHPGGGRGAAELERWGLPFNRTPDGFIDQRRFGGHTANHGERPVKRACYAADRTGHMILQTLYQQCVKRDVRFFNEFYCLDLLRTDDGRTAGVVAYELATGQLHVFRAKSVLFATGGYGRMFRVSSNAHALTGDGPSVAFRRGIPLEDMEFFQFHPTGLYRLGVLLSEGARGEGAILRNRDGERFMERYAPTIKDLAPRDVVSRSIYQEIREGRGLGPKGDYLYLDLTHLDPKVLEEKLPDITEFARVYLQVEPTREPVPIQPTAHYAMGGIPTDVRARVVMGSDETPVPGLYAAGECACVSVHGANRLGTNSLLDIVVFGRRGGHDMTRHCAETDLPALPPDATAHTLEMLDGILTRQTGDNVADIRSELQDSMFDLAFVVRTEESLAKMGEILDGLRDRYDRIAIGAQSDRFLPERLQLRGVRSRRRRRPTHVRAWRTSMIDLFHCTASRSNAARSARSGSESCARGHHVSSTHHLRPERTELALDDEPAELAVLAMDGDDAVLHEHRAAIGGGQVRRGHGGRADAAAGEFERPAEEVEVDVVGATHVGAEAAVPQPRALRGIRHREVDDDVEPARERLVDVRPQVRREDREPVEGLHALQQVGALDVGVAVVRVLHLGALAEDRVGLVEEQHGVRARRGSEDALEVLLGLADVLVDDRREVDDVEVEAELAGDDLGGHRLAGARVAREQRDDAVPATAARAHAPVAEHLLAVPGPQLDLAQRAQRPGRQHEVVPADRLASTRRASRSSADAFSARAPAARCSAVITPDRRERRLRASGSRGALHLLRPQPERAGRLCHVEPVGRRPERRAPELRALGGCGRLDVMPPPAARRNQAGSHVESPTNTVGCGESASVSIERGEIPA